MLLLLPLLLRCPAPPAPVAVAAVAAPPAAVAPAPAPAPPAPAELNVFFFDLDETLASKSLEEDPTLVELDRPTAASWIYTTNQVLDILRRINDDPNSKWYIVSAGGNIQVLRLLEDRLGIHADGAVFEKRKKSTEIVAILDQLTREDYNIKSITFIDDSPENIEEVITALPSYKSYSC